MTFTRYTGYEYILIDIANQYGKDKLIFEQRIQWTRDNLLGLELLADEADCKPLYLKAVMALRKAQQGIPSGHRVGLDAVCSGTQIMAVLTGCMAGADATGLVDPNRRADAYTQCTEVMKSLLGNAFALDRKDIKRAFMTSFFGSKRVPKVLFGEATPELGAFYQALETIAPGPWALMEVLLNSWQGGAKCHDWKLPDGFDAHIPVMIDKDCTIEVDELDGSTFTMYYKVNGGLPNGHMKAKSNAANVVHSVDGMIVREMHRRCNYNRGVMEYVASCIEAEQVRRMLGGVRDKDYIDVSGKLGYYMEQYRRSGMPCAVILPHIDSLNVQGLETKHLKALSRMVNGMLEHKSFELVTVHDEFSAHPNNLNWVRQHYIDILAELADAEVLSDILSQIHGKKGHYPKLSKNLSASIRASSYAIC